MQKQLLSRCMLVAILIWLAGTAPQSLIARTPEPIVYTIKFPAPETHYAEVEVKAPTGRRASIDLMMAIWSPGFYRVEDYAGRVEGFSARTPDGRALEVEQPQSNKRLNRWRIQTSGAPAVIVSYRLLCNGRSVTTNWVGDDLLVLNGAATFITLVEQARRPHEVRLELAPNCSTRRFSARPAAGRAWTT